MNEQKQQSGIENPDPIQGIEQMINSHSEMIATHQQLSEQEAGLWVICAEPGLSDVITEQTAIDFVLGYPYPDQQQSSIAKIPAFRLHRSVKLAGDALTWTAFPAVERQARQLRQQGIKCHAIAAEDWHAEQIAGLNRLNEVLRDRRRQLVYER